MNTNNFTIKAQEALQKAQQSAAQRKHTAVEPVHILAAVLQVDENVAPFILSKLSVNSKMIADTLASMIASLPTTSGDTQPYFSRPATEVLQQANMALKKWGDEFVALEHLILGLFKTKDQASALLKDSGITEKALVTAINELRKGNKANSSSAENAYNALGKYAVNLNEKAKSGKLDPVIGRDEEIRRVLHILARRTKNNPIRVTYLRTCITSRYMLSIWELLSLGRNTKESLKKDSKQWSTKS